VRWPHVFDTLVMHHKFGILEKEFYPREDKNFSTGEIFFKGPLNPWIRTDRCRFSRWMGANSRWLETFVYSTQKFRVHKITCLIIYADILKLYKQNSILLYNSAPAGIFLWFLSIQKEYDRADSFPFNSKGIWSCWQFSFRYNFTTNDFIRNISHSKIVNRFSIFEWVIFWLKLHFCP